MPKKKIWVRLPYHAWQKYSKPSKDHPKKQKMEWTDLEQRKQAMNRVLS